MSTIIAHLWYQTVERSSRCPHVSTFIADLWYQAVDAFLIGTATTMRARIFFLVIDRVQDGFESTLNTVAVRSTVRTGP